MVKCPRCGWSFSAVRMAEGASCPRCRLREGVSAPLAETPTGRSESFLDLIADATRRLEQSRQGRLSA